MNLHGWILLVALVLVALLEIGVGLLTLLRKPQPIPTFFQDMVDGDEFAKSQAYVADQTRLEIVSQFYNLAILLAFWFMAGFPWLESKVLALGHGVLVSGLIFLFVLSVSSYVLGLPLELYRIFVLDEKYGLNRTTWAVFISDLSKGSLLALVLGGPLLTAILAFLIWAGEWGWLACWLVSVVLIGAIQYVAPRWIMPLFLKFTPLPEGELRLAILEYARRVNFPVGEISVVDGSRRSTKANAFFSGFGNNRRIALFDTLVERLTVAEMVGVVAHEVGHDRHGHLIKGMATAMIHLGVMFWLLSLFLSNGEFFRAFSVEQPSVYMGLALFSLFFAPLDMLFSLAWKAVSRRFEWQADAFAISSTGDAMALATALKKLAVANLSQLTPHPLHVLLHASHPPVVQRVDAMLNNADANG